MKSVSRIKVAFLAFVLVLVCAPVSLSAPAASSSPASTPTVQRRAPQVVAQAKSEPDAERFNELVRSGGIAKSRGMYREAEKLLKEAVDIGLATKVEKTQMLVPLNNLAGTYMQLGKLTEAEATYKDVLGALEELKMRHNMSYATVLDNLGQVYSRKGDLVQCEQMQREAIEIYAKSDNPNARQEQAIAMANLAQTYVEEKKFALAESNFRAALKTLEDLDPDSSIVAILLDNYSALYRKQGKFAEALEQQERAVKLLEKTLGRNHPEVAIALSNIAFTYTKLHRETEAKDCLERALEINEKAFGTNSAPATASLGRMIAFLRSTNKASEAKQYELRLLQAGGTISVPHKP